MNNSQVAHLWANQSKPKARGSNFYFEGRSIYSYGSHFEIARIVKPTPGGVILFTTKSYSNSTARHKSYTARAISSSYNTFYVPRLDITEAGAHKENVAHYASMIIEARTDALRARAHGAAYAKRAQELREDLNNYKATFKIKGKTKLPGLLFTSKQLDEINARAQKAEAADKVRRERARARAAAEEAAHVIEWRAGTYNGQLYHTPTMLRVNKDEIETSKGARVPLDAGRLIYKRSKRAEVMPGQHIGSFEINEIGPEVVIIGCHEIPLKEIEALAVALGW